MTKDEHEERRTQELEHARWRISFVESMLQSHQAMPWKTDDWHRKEKELIDRLTAAKEELARLSVL